MSCAACRFRLFALAAGRGRILIVSLLLLSRLCGSGQGSRCCGSTAELTVSGFALRAVCVFNRATAFNEEGKWVRSFWGRHIFAERLLSFEACCPLSVRVALRFRLGERSLLAAVFGLNWGAGGPTVAA